MMSSLSGRRLSSFSMICLMAACISRADASSSPSPTPSLKKNLSGSIPHGVEMYLLAVEREMTEMS